MMTDAMACPALSGRFTEAVAFAIRAHGDQCRKGGDIPYVAHLLGVASLVLEAGGDEDLAIAGLLHDTLEDTETTAEGLASAFGLRVASVVEGCTDAHERPKPEWRERKEQYLSHLRSPETPIEVLVVSRADKLHNARAILQDYRDVGEQIWSRFKEGPEQQRWYYGSLVDIFTERLPGSMTDELSRVVEELEAELARMRSPRPTPAGDTYPPSLESSTVTLGRPRSLAGDTVLSRHLAGKGDRLPKYRFQWDATHDRLRRFLLLGVEVFRWLGSTSG